MFRLYMCMVAWCWLVGLTVAETSRGRAIAPERDLARMIPAQKTECCLDNTMGVLLHLHPERCPTLLYAFGPLGALSTWEAVTQYATQLRNMKIKT